MEKYTLLPEQLLYEGTVEEKHFFKPGRLDVDTILLTHDPNYYDKLLNNNLTKKEARKIGFPIRPELIERGHYIAQGTIDCAVYAKEYGISLNIAGGTHHAYADHGEGFCVFNDFAIAANYLLHNKKAKKILIIDLDVHQGNGTANIFRENPQVFTFSMHGANNYPLRKEKSDLDIALANGTGDHLYVRILKNVLPQLIDEVEPDHLFYLSGVDVLEIDKLGQLAMSRNGCKERDRIVLEIAKKNNIPISVSMGGGYAPRLADIVDAHANTYRLAQEIFF